MPLPVHGVFDAENEQVDSRSHCRANVEGRFSTSTFARHAACMQDACPSANTPDNQHVYSNGTGHTTAAGSENAVLRKRPQRFVGSGVVMRQSRMNCVCMHDS